MRHRSALALAALALAGCETTAEKSAKLERAAKRQRHAAADNGAEALAIGHAGSHVEVVDATLVHSSEGTAAVVSCTTARASAARSPDR